MWSRNPPAGRLRLPGLICAPGAGPDYAVRTGLSERWTLDPASITGLI